MLHETWNWFFKALVGMLVVFFLVILFMGGLVEAKTVRNDPGGPVAKRMRETAKLRKAGTPIRFAGKCASACTVYLTLPPSQICATRHAEFYFHKARPNMKAVAQLARKVKKPRKEVLKVVNHVMIRFNREWFASYPRWVRTWIRNNGGWSNRLIHMPNSYVRKHVRAC